MAGPENPTNQHELDKQKKENVFQAHLLAQVGRVRGLAGAEAEAARLNNLEEKVKALEGKENAVVQLISFIGLMIELWGIEQDIYRGQNKEEERIRVEKAERRWKEEYRKVQENAQENARKLERAVEDIVEPALRGEVTDPQELREKAGKALRAVENANEKASEPAKTREISRKEAEAQELLREREREAREMERQNEARVDEASVEEKFAKALTEEDPGKRRAGVQEVLQSMSPEEQRQFTRRMERAGGQKKLEYDLEDDMLRFMQRPEEADEEFEQFFDRAHARPGESFHQSLDMYEMIRLNNFLEVFGDEDAIRLFEKSLGGGKLEAIGGSSKVRDMMRNRQRRFTERLKLLSTMHDGSGAFEEGFAKPDQFKDVLKTLKSHQFNWLFEGEDGKAVAASVRLWEQAMMESNAYKGCVDSGDMAPSSLGGVKNGGVDHSKEVQAVVERRVKRRLREQLFADFMRKEGNKAEDFDKKWTAKKIERAVVHGKEYGLLSLRLPEISAMQRRDVEVAVAATEEGEDGKQKHIVRKKNPMVSPWLEKIVRVLSPDEHMFRAYQKGDPMYALLGFMLGSKDMPQDGRKVKQLLQDAKDGKIDLNRKIFANMRNWFEAGGVGTNSNWRYKEAAGDFIGRLVTKENKLDRLLGANIRLARLDSKDPGYEKKRAEIWNDVLWMNPLKLLQEYNTSVEVDGKGEYFKAGWLDVFREYGSQATGEPDADFEIRMRKEIFGLDNYGEKLFDADGVYDWLLQAQGDSLQSFDYKAGGAQINPETFLKYDILQDPEQRDKAQKLAAAIREVNKKRNMVGHLAKADARFPFGVGTDDLRFDVLDYSKMGDEGFERRLRDFAGATGAFGGLMDFMDAYKKLGKSTDVAVKFDDLVLKPARTYNAETAARIAEQAAKGFCDFHDQRDWWKMPWPLNALLEEYVPNSVAEHAFGEDAMLWTAKDRRNFIRSMAHFGSFGDDREEVEKRLYTMTNSRRRDEWREGVMRYGLAGVVFVMAELVKEVIEIVQEDMKK